MRIHKPPMSIMRQVTSRNPPGVADDIRDTMAIPSFLHWNPLIRHLVWQRYVKIAEMASFSEGQTILEFGCGPGFFIPEINSHGCRIQVVDLYPQFARELCRILGIDAGTFLSLREIPDDSVSTAIASEVFEHLESPGLYLEHFKRILLPGGSLIVSLPTENILYRAGRFLAGFQGKADYHISNLEDILACFEEHGFSMVGSVSIPTPLLPLYRVLQYRVENSV